MSKDSFSLALMSIGVFFLFYNLSSMVRIATIGNPDSSAIAAQIRGEE